ncbi:MAG: hypothetical protein IT416_03160, partial [Candidatus Pacebacteria bacterium]|nr:hypothetical protein [Candidatus Paceibacterota bacterium]
MREIFRKITDSSANWLQQRIENSIQGQGKDNKNLLSRIALDKLKRRSQSEQVVPQEFEAKFNQWRTVIEQDRYELSNPDETGEIRRFYSMANGIYGEPLITAEPDLAFALPPAVSFVNAKGKVIDQPSMKISGIICQSKAEVGDGEEVSVVVDHRVSLSNKGTRTIEQTEDGLIINGERWYLKTLFSKDGNRIKNYDAYYVKTKPESVQFLELQDINFVGVNQSTEHSEQTETEQWRELLTDKTDLKRLAKLTYKKLKRKLESLDPENKPLAEYQFKQWTFRFWADRYEIVNLEPDGTERFYKVIKGKYGEPIIVAEPDRAYSSPENAEYANAKGETIPRPEGDISGIICQNENGSVAHRFSLSNPKTPKFRVTKDGLILFLKDEAGKVTKERWYLNTMFAKDKNRVKNHD